MIKRFTLAEYLRALRLGKRNRTIYISLYDSKTYDDKNAMPLFKRAIFPFDRNIKKIIAQNNDRFVATIDTQEYFDRIEQQKLLNVKIYLSNKNRHYKGKLTIYQVFIDGKKSFTSSNKLETEIWLSNNKELWLNPNEKHKMFGVIHRAQKGEFDNLVIDTIVLDEYDNVIQNDKE